MGKAGTSASRFVKRNTKPAPAPRSETADKILDLAERLIQTRGCSAFSYQDIADALKIRKASIHYHFESKTDLVTAVIDRYTEKFDAALNNIARDETATSMSMLEHYVEPYAAFAATPDRVCLCGALSGEMLALPPELRERVVSLLQVASALAHANPQTRCSARRIQAARSRPQRQPGLSSAHCRARFWSSARPEIPRN